MLNAKPIFRTKPGTKHKMKTVGITQALNFEII